jgi:hypothetical protein
MESASAYQKTRWVGRYAKGITALGVLTILGGLLYGGIGACEFVHKWRQVPGSVAGMVIIGTFHMCIVGLLVIGLADLLAYAIGGRQRAGWILRNASKGLFLLAGSVIASGACQLSPMLRAHWTFLQLTVVVLSTVMSALTSVALAFTVSRVLPVIDEYKTVI